MPESTGSDAVAAHPAGIGRGRPRAGYPCDGLLGLLTLCSPVCRPRDRVAADPGSSTRGCQLPTQLSDGCGSLRSGSPGVGGLTLAHASSAGLPAPGRECLLRPLRSTSLRPSGIDRACSSSGRLGRHASAGPPGPGSDSGHFAGRRRVTWTSAGGAGRLTSAECGGPFLSAH